MNKNLENYLNQAIKNLECALVELGEGKEHDELIKIIKRLDKLNK